MFKSTDLLSLGTEYTVSDQNGNIVKSIQIVPQSEIIEAIAGNHVPDNETYSSYLDRAISLLTGFDEIDYTRVLWHATNDDEVVLSELIEYAVHKGYDKIILEHLEDLE